MRLQNALKTSVFEAPKLVTTKALLLKHYYHRQGKGPFPAISRAHTPLENSQGIASCIFFVIICCEGAVFTKKNMLSIPTTFFVSFPPLPTPPCPRHFPSPKPRFLLDLKTLTVSGSSPTPWPGPFRDHGQRPWSQFPSEHRNPRNKWGFWVWSSHFWIWSRRPGAQGVGVDPFLDLKKLLCLMEETQS